MSTATDAIKDKIRARKAKPAEVGTCFSLVVVDSIMALVKSTHSDLKEGKARTVNTKAIAREAAAGINLSHQMNTRDTLRLQ